MYRYNFSVVPPVEHTALDEQYPTHWALAFTNKKYSENRLFNTLPQFGPYVATPSISADLEHLKSSH